MTTGLYCRCIGGNSTVIAMSKRPETFTHVKSLVLLMVVSGRTFIKKGADLMHLDPRKAAEELDERLRELTGMRLNQQTPQLYSRDEGANIDDPAPPGLPHSRGGRWTVHL